MSALQLISADDHVLEPPDLWTTRLPSRLIDDGPRVVRRPIEDHDGGAASTGWADWWIYADKEIPLLLNFASAGCGDVDTRPVTYEEVRPGCWQQDARLADMDLNSVEVSVCFPNVVPRFCGQTFLENGDRDLARACVQAYNDWVIDDWSGGSGRGRLVPVTIVPLWDIEEAVREVERCAAMGSFAVSFSENPAELGLPSFHSRDHYWDPLFAACSDTDTVVNLHVGSSSRSPTTSADAPSVMNAALIFFNAAAAFCDLLISGCFERHPRLKVVLSEGQAGWIPYVTQTLDALWRERDTRSTFGIHLPHPPSTYIADHLFAVVFDDLFGIVHRDELGIEQLLFETDYPHHSGSFPNSAAVADSLCTRAGLNQSERHHFLRGNAIEIYGLERIGVRP